MKKPLFYCILLVGVVASYFIACQGIDRDNTKEANVSKDEYKNGLFDLGTDSFSLISELNFVQHDSYSESNGYGTLTFHGNYVGLPTKWAITLKTNKAVIVSFDYSTQNTSSTTVAHLVSWTTNLKNAVTGKYGEPWEDSLNAGDSGQSASKKVVWRMRATDSLNEEVIVLSLSSDSYEHPPFTKHYDVQFKHFYVADAPKWYRTMID